MTAEALRYRWSPAEFLRAWDAGVFDHRVELVEGEVWPVPIGDWHGATTARVLRALPNDRFVVTTATLPTGASLPDPDCWVRPATAAPVAAISGRLSSWRAQDVLLVVEVADETEAADLGVKARLYARAGYACYWVVTRAGIAEHTDPAPDGYRAVRLHRPEERIALRHAGTDLRVAALIQP